MIRLAPDSMVEHAHYHMAVESLAVLSDIDQVTLVEAIPDEEGVVFDFRNALVHLPLLVGTDDLPLSAEGADALCAFVVKHWDKTLPEVRDEAQSHDQ